MTTIDNKITCGHCGKLLGYGYIESFRGNYTSYFRCVEHKDVPPRNDEW